MGLNFKLAWGIELGNSAVSAVKVQMVKGEAQIVSHHCVSYESPVENDEDFHDMASQGLSRLISEAGIKKSDPIVTAIPGRSVFARPVTLPPMDSKRIPELIQYEASQQIPFPIEEVVWDYHVVQPDQEGEEISATIFAVRREEIDELISIFTEVGLQVQGIQTTPLAILNFVRYDINPEDACLIIDVKSSNIDFIIHNGQDFWQRNITRGGNDINKALMSKFKIPYSQAEELKQTIESNQQASKILKVIQPIFKSMSNEIQRSISHYRSQHEGVQLKRVLLIGGSVRMAKLVEHFKTALRLKIIGVNKLGKLSKNCQDPSAINKELPSLTVPIALALQGVGAASVSLNLIPPDVIAKRAQIKKMPWLIAASVIFLIGGWLYFGSISQANTILSNISGKPKKQLQILQAQVSEIEESKNLIAPRKKELFEWRRVLRDHDTFFPRDAHVFALDEIHQTIFRETTDERDLVFIEKFTITKQLPSNKEIVIQKIKNLPELDKSAADLEKNGKIFHISLTGTFFQQTAERSENINYVENRIIDQLNGKSDVFFNWKRTSLDRFTSKENTDVFMQRFIVEGYFSPTKYREYP